MCVCGYACVRERGLQPWVIMVCNGGWWFDLLCMAIHTHRTHRPGRVHARTVNCLFVIIGVYVGITYYAFIYGVQVHTGVGLQWEHRHWCVGETAVAVDCGNSHCMPMHPTGGACPSLSLESHCLGISLANIVQVHIYVCHLTQCCMLFPSGEDNSAACCAHNQHVGDTLVGCTPSILLVLILA